MLLKDTDRDFKLADAQIRKGLYLVTILFACTIIFVLFVNTTVLFNKKTSLEVSKYAIQGHSNQKHSLIQTHLRKIQKTLDQISFLLPAQLNPDRTLHHLTPYLKMSVDNNVFVEDVGILTDTGAIVAHSLMTAPPRGNQPNIIYSSPSSSNGIRNYKKVFLLKKKLLEKGQIVTMVMPLENNNGTIRGVIAARINADKLWATILDESKNNLYQYLWINSQGYIIKKSSNFSDSHNLQCVGNILAKIGYNIPSHSNHSHPEYDPHHHSAPPNDQETVSNFEWSYEEFEELYRFINHNNTILNSKSNLTHETFIDHNTIVALTNDSQLNIGIMSFMDNSLFPLQNMYRNILIFSSTALVFLFYLLFIWRLLKNRDTLSSLNEQTKEKQILNSTILQSISDGLILLTPSQVVINQNNIAKNFLENRLANTHHKGTLLTDIWSSALFPELQESFKVLLKTKKLQTIKIFDKSLELEIILSPLKKSINSIYMVVLVFKDISAITHYKEKLRVLEAKIDHDAESHTSYLNKFYEEILSLTGKVHAYHQNSVKQGSLKASQQDMVDVNINIQRIENLIAFIEGQSQDKLNLSECCIPELIESTINNYTHLLSQKNLDYEFFTDPNLPQLAIIDNKQFERLLSTLLNHAIDVTDSGFVGLWIRRNPQQKNQIYIQIESSSPHLFNNNILYYYTHKMSINNIPQMWTEIGLPMSNILHSLKTLKGTIVQASDYDEIKFLLLQLPIMPIYDAVTNALYPLLKDICIILITSNIIREKKVETFLSNYNPTIYKYNDIRHVIDALHGTSAISNKDNMIIIADQKSIDILHQQTPSLIGNIPTYVLPKQLTYPVELVAEIKHVIDAHKEQTSQKSLTQRLSEMPQVQEQDYDELIGLDADSIHVVLTMKKPESEDSLFSQLQSLGYKISFAQNQNELSKILKNTSSTVDAIIIDHDVEHINGIDITHSIRTLQADINNIPIFLLINNISPELAKHAHIAGISQIIQKPISVKKISFAIKSFITSFKDQIIIDNEELTKSEEELGLSFIRELAINFLKDTNKRLILINTALSCGDMIEIAKQISQLIGTSDTISAIYVKKICLQIAEDCEREDLLAAANSAKTLTHAMKNTEEWLKIRYNISHIDTS